MMLIADIASATYELTSTGMAGTNKPSLYVSFMGGAKVSVTGSGFAEMPNRNKVRYTVNADDIAGFP